MLATCHPLNANTELRSGRTLLLVEDFRSIQTVNEKSGCSYCLPYGMLSCASSNVSPENWHMLVNIKAFISFLQNQYVVPRTRIYDDFAAKTAV